MKTENLKTKALSLHDNGLTVMPLYGVDLFEWRDYRNSTQTKQDIEGINWGAAIGMSVIAGSYHVNNIKAVKFGIRDMEIKEVINKVLSALSLPVDYPWVAISTDKSSFVVIIQGEYLQGVTLITGEWEKHRVHIIMEGTVFIPKYFDIPKGNPLRLDNAIMNRFLYSIRNIHGLQTDERGHYKYYK